MASIRALLIVTSLPYVRSNRGQIALLLTAISLGVSAIVAAGTLVDSAISSIESTWSIGSESADYRLANGSTGVPESLLERVRSIEGVDSASAIVSGIVRIRFEHEHADLVVVGLDVFDRASVHESAISKHMIPGTGTSLFLSHPGAVILPASLNQAHDLAVGAPLVASTPTGASELIVAGFARTVPRHSDPTTAVALMDLFAAQSMLGRPGLFDAIDVTLASSESDTLDRLEAVARGVATISSPSVESAEFRSLLFSVRLILGVAGALASVVGALVVFNAISMAISQRAQDLATVRRIGVSRRSTVSLIVVEGALLGIVGSVIGIASGLGLARASASLFHVGIASLYVPIAHHSSRVSWRYVAWATIVGVGVSVFASVLSSRGAIRDRHVRDGGRERWRSAMQLAIAGAIFIVVGAALQLLQGRSLDAEVLAVVAVGRDTMILLGAGLLLPVLVFAATRRRRPPFTALKTIALRLALGGVSGNPARSTVVLTSIMIGAAYVVISLGVVESLKSAVSRWIGGSSTASIIVTAPGSVGFLPSSPKLSGSLYESLATHPSVKAVDALQLSTQPFEDRWVTVAARSIDLWSALDRPELVSGDLSRARRTVASGDGVIASQHFAEKHDLEVGSVVSLRSPSGNVDLVVEAVVVDYTSADLGAVFVSNDFFERTWLDTSVASFRIWLHDDSEASATLEELEFALGPHCNCSLTTGEEFAALSASVVDAGFYTAYALEVVAILVMVVSVVCFYVVSLRERRNEIESLRRIGASRRQVAEMFLWESLLLGVFGGAIGASIGTGLAALMVTSTVRIGGGMVLPLTLPPWSLQLAVFGSVFLCVASAAFPIWSSCYRSPIDAAMAVNE